MFKRLGIWWRRSITVYQPDPDHDVSRILIDHGDGWVYDLVAHRNDTFALAWICAEAQAQGMRLMTLTLTNEGNPEELQVQTLEIPDWARRRLFRGVAKIAKQFGWQGQCPRPTKSYAFR